MRRLLDAHRLGRAVVVSIDGLTRAKMTLPTSPARTVRYTELVASPPLLRTLQRLADERVLGALLDQVRRDFGGYDLLLHHQQGEFHHDVFLRVANPSPDLPGAFLVISTNCNGGVKEVLCFAEPVEPAALWHSRCPENAAFVGALPRVLASARTEHWFDPCELLSPGARSELKEEFRERQLGGGWCKKVSA